MTGSTATRIRRVTSVTRWVTTIRIIRDTFIGIMTSLFTLLLFFRYDLQSLFIILIMQLFHLVLLLLPQLEFFQKSILFPLLLITWGMFTSRMTTCIPPSKHFIPPWPPYTQMLSYHYILSIFGYSYRLTCLLLYFTISRKLYESFRLLYYLFLTHLFITSTVFTNQFFVLEYHCILLFFIVFLEFAFSLGRQSNSIQLINK
jgi:hypothetical protein